jgi:hypothetical protein
MPRLIFQQGGVVARVAEHETGFQGRAEGHSINIGAIAETTDGFDEELLNPKPARAVACRAWLVLADPSSGDPSLADRELDARCSAGLARPYRR